MTNPFYRWIIALFFMWSWSAYAQPVETGGYTAGPDYPDWLACGGYTETTAPDINFLFTVDNNNDEINPVRFTGPVRVAAYTVMLPRYNTVRIVLRSADGSLHTVDKVPKAF